MLASDSPVRPGARLVVAQSVTTGALLLALTTAGLAADLTVRVDGVNGAGLIRIEIDDSAAAWDNKALARANGRVHAAPGSVSYTFKDLPKGDYAIGVYHDANENVTLDMNFLGVPKEALGFSNNPSITRKPRFDETRFSHGEDDQTITIDLVHLLD